MNKRPVQPTWFEHLRTRSHQDHLKWLAQLTRFVDRIADFGCWGSSEPLALLWTLDATEVVVIEKEGENLAWPKEELRLMRIRNPQCMEGRSARFVTADMSMEVEELESDYFDLVFCENVLYDIELESGEDAVQTAISEMARVVRPERWAIAVEPKLGPNFRSDPVDVDPLFLKSGLSRASLVSAPNGAYCYRKLPKREVSFVS